MRYKRVPNSESGHCPGCNEPIDDYGQPVFEGDMIYFPWACHCGLEGREYSSIMFDAQHVEVEDLVQGMFKEKN